MDIFNRLKGMSILLIDDDEWIRDSLGIFFENEGCTLLSFETAEEGIALLDKQSCEIIIVDYRLPGMNGLEFFKRIKGTYSKSIKILITAYGSDEVLKEAMNIGVHDLIKKPITTRKIEESLSRLFMKQA